MSMPTTPLSCSPSSVGATATVAVSATAAVGEADGSAMAEGWSVTATHPPAQASTPVAELPAAFITGHSNASGPIFRAASGVRWTA